MDFYETWQVDRAWEEEPDRLGFFWDHFMPDSGSSYCFYFIFLKILFVSDLDYTTKH